MRISLAAGKLLIELLLELGIEEVLHAFRGLVEMVGRKGSTTRDFCHVANVVQANLLAATVDRVDAQNQVYNVAVGGRTTLLELYGLLRGIVEERRPGLRVPEPVHADFRPGDVRHSQADISKAQRLLAYAPMYDLRAGLREAFGGYAGG